MERHRNSWIIQSFNYEELSDQHKSEKKMNKNQKIENIIEKVIKWQNSSSEYKKSSNKLMLHCKIKAAKELGDKKKTLDDFLTKLRLGIVYDFDFANHLNDKFIILRNFIKEQANIIKWKSNLHKDVDSLLLLIKPKE